MYKPYNSQGWFTLLVSNFAATKYFYFVSLNQDLHQTVFCFLWRCGPTRAMASSFLRFLDHTQRRITVGRTSLDEISPSQRPLPDNTQLSTQTDIHAPSGIRTHNPSKLAAVDPRLRPRGHWDLPFRKIFELKILICVRCIIVNVRMQTVAVASYKASIITRRAVLCSLGSSRPRIHHQKHQRLDPLIRSVSRVTAACASASSVFQLFSFPLVCSGMISKGFGFVAFFASVKASSVCIHLSSLVCL